METHQSSEACLSWSYSLDLQSIESYKRNGFVRLSGVLDEEVIRKYGSIISNAVVDLSTMHLPMDERSTYDKAFLQVTNLWRSEEFVKPLVFSKRLAEIAANLLEVDSVRLYHDQALYKEPGGGHTPWHADQFYWPLATSKCVTAWIPLQETPLELGPLEFGSRSHLSNEGRDLEIGDESESEISRMLDQTECQHVVEPFAIGDVSFHSGWTFHRAGPNRSSLTRRVMCVIYMDASMRLSSPVNENQKLDRKAWCPGIEVGEIIDSELNPVLYRRDELT